MSNYLKPQSPLYHKTEDAYFYPLTTVDQIIMEDNTRLNDKINDIVNTSTQISNSMINKAETVLCTGTFLVDNWSSEAPYTQTINVKNLLEADNPLIDVNLADAADASAVIEGWMLVGRVVANNGQLTGYCYNEKPTVDIPMILKVVR